MVGNGSTGKRATLDPSSLVLQHTKVIYSSTGGKKEHTRAFCSWQAQLSVDLEGATSIGISAAREEFHKTGTAWKEGGGGGNLQ
ncbi:hypothetical protein AMTR_s00040p00029220 [Amborella trichopoda]|uniref:Uncharacterized protein n=1 Tax=Amborella trichopoda TaxID=13333 RepID=W1PYD8_AMBTC|nr:hypothetical protein AMTR_s00040p00029220 [Amborella trichopoda]